MNTQWQILGQEYQLFRFPPNQHDKSLQAWDSADELIIQHLHQSDEDKITLQERSAEALRPNMLIMNDNFGALAIGLNQFKPICVCDSYVSQMAIEHNSVVNNCPVPIIQHSLIPLDQIFSNGQKRSSADNVDVQREMNNSVATVVIKVTKNLDFLAYQLQQIKQYCQETNSTVDVVAGGKTTLITSAVMAMFEQYLTEVKSSKAKKKSRLIFAVGQPTPTLPLPLLDSGVPTFQAACPSLGLSLYSHANVFGKKQIDIGGRFLAENLPNLPNTDNDIRVIDLGCGNGLLGVEFMKQNLKAIVEFVDPLRFSMLFCDESYMATQSAKYNIEHTVTPLLMKSHKTAKHQLETVDSICEFEQDDCLTKQAPESADIVLCNPPFHQQQAVTTHIGEQMIHQTSKVLKPGGELYLVANRHLPYQSMLKKAFGGFRVLATNNKFTIYVCVKKHAR